MYHTAIEEVLAKPRGVLLTPVYWPNSWILEATESFWVTKELLFKFTGIAENSALGIGVADNSALGTGVADNSDLGENSYKLEGNSGDGWLAWSLCMFSLISTGFVA